MNAPQAITADDLIVALIEADVLETFNLLPRADQEKFAYWIGKARNDATHWALIHALVLALRTGPLRPSDADVSVYRPGSR